MARFTTTKTSSHGFIKTIAFLLLFAVVLVVFLVGINNMNTSSNDHQRETLETALNRDIVYCYATEGSYPADLEYIKEHYGLIYNESRFFVGYRLMGANIYPDVTIIELEG